MMKVEAELAKKELLLKVTNGYNINLYNFSVYPTWRTSDFCISIMFKDNFFSSYTKESTVDLVGYQKATSKNLYIKNLKRRLTYKNNQFKKLVALHEQALEIIKDFLVDSFFVDKDKIKDSDITFSAHTFEVAGESFFWEGAMSDFSFTIMNDYNNSAKVYAIKSVRIFRKYGVDINKIKI